MLSDQLVAAPSIGQTIDPVNGYHVSLDRGLGELIVAVCEPLLCGASAAGDFDHSTPTRQVFGVHQQASEPAALLAPIQKVALFFLSASGL